MTAALAPDADRLAQTTEESSRVLGYLARLAALRQALAFSRDDAAFVRGAPRRRADPAPAADPGGDLGGDIDGDAREGEREGARGRILYFVDSNVAHLFFDPASNQQHVDPVGMRSPVVGHDVLCAAITAEFLFSGALPGQVEKRLFLDPGHAEELLRQIPHLREKAGAVAITPENRAAVLREAEALRQRLLDAERRHDDPATREAALEDLQKALDDLLNLVRAHDLEPLCGALLLKRLLSGATLSPLRRAPLIPVDLILDGPPADLVAQWRARLAAAKRSRPEPSGRRDENRERDARCLARLEAANARLALRGVAARCVLVTSDETIHEAQARWLIERHGGPERVIFSRRVVQYMPLTTYRDMPNFTRDDAPTRLIESTVDLFLRPLLIGPGDFTPRLARLQRWLADMSGALRDAQDERRDGGHGAAVRARLLMGSLAKVACAGAEATINLVRARWGALLAKALAANTPLLARRFEGLLGGLGDEVARLRDDEPLCEGLARRLASAQRGAAHALRDLHLELLLQWRLAGDATRFAAPPAALNAAALFPGALCAALTDLLAAAPIDPERLIGRLRAIAPDDFVAQARMAAVYALAIDADDLAPDIAEAALEADTRADAARAETLLLLAVALRRRFEACAAAPEDGGELQRDVARRADRAARSAASVFMALGDAGGARRARAESAATRIALMRALMMSGARRADVRDLQAAIDAMDAVALGVPRSERDLGGRSLAALAAAGAAGVVVDAVIALRLGRPGDRGRLSASLREGVARAGVHLRADGAGVEPAWLLKRDLLGGDEAASAAARLPHATRDAAWRARCASRLDADFLAAASQGRFA